MTQRFMQASAGQAPLFAAHNSDVAQCCAPSRAFAAQPARPQTGTQGILVMFAACKWIGIIPQH